MLMFTEPKRVLKTVKNNWENFKVLVFIFGEIIIKLSVRKR